MCVIRQVWRFWVWCYRPSRWRHERCSHCRASVDRWRRSAEAGRGAWQRSAIDRCAWRACTWNFVSDLHIGLIMLGLRLCKFDSDILAWLDNDWYYSTDMSACACTMRPPRVCLCKSRPKWQLHVGFGLCLKKLIIATHWENTRQPFQNLRAESVFVFGIKW